jgi:hypothetical protein
MVIRVYNLPAILAYKGVPLDKRVNPVEKIPVLNNNNNNRSFNEQKKNDDKATAAILRISEQGKSQTRTDRVCKTAKRSGK